MDSATATIVFGCLQAVVMGFLGFAAKAHNAEMRVQSSNQRQFAQAISELSRVIGELGNRLTVQQERFDAHDRLMGMGFEQLRKAVSDAAQCSLDPTEAKDIHEAARNNLRTRSV